MGIIVAYGLCSAIGLFFGPLHNVLPFLLLGIGIDDMFVIVQCLKTADEQREEDETLGTTATSSANSQYHFTSIDVNLSSFSALMLER